MLKQRENGDYLGLRNVDEIVRMAAVHGWQLQALHDMPKGNLTLVLAVT